MKVKGLKVDVRTGKREVVEEEMELPAPVKPEVFSVDLKDLQKLIQYAKKVGWV